MLPDRPLSLSLFAVALLVPACSGSDEPSPKPAPSATQPASPNASVRFKGPDRLRNDLARALALSPNEICNELGAYSCTDKVHVVTLGGVSAYEHQIYEPLRTTVASTPLAADRVVLSACLERAKRDFESPAGAVVWRGIEVDATSALADPKSAAVTTAIEALYAALLSRRATEAEIAALRGFHGAVVKGAPPKPAESWAALSCYAVGTSVEFLFY